MPDGTTQREHLLAAVDGMFPDPLAEAKLAAVLPLPACGGLLWAIFCELHGRRAYAEFGPVRWSWLELEAYAGVSRRLLDPHTLRTLFALEDEFFAVQAENKK